MICFSRSAWHWPHYTELFDQLLDGFWNYDSSTCSHGCICSRRVVLLRYQSGPTRAADRTRRECVTNALDRRSVDALLIGVPGHNNRGVPHRVSSDWSCAYAEPSTDRDLVADRGLNSSICVERSGVEYGAALRFPSRRFRLTTRSRTSVHGWPTWFSLRSVREQASGSW